ncbi:hypothetical protein [Nocardioides sp. W7]|uniref:hypothetical protein n=1 Tax=Nocardioides sp. W7 TaxID=2931390 RepID=UPI001FD1A364|nr:hypothetical protein [Nocardioides sp. W7]
MVVARVAVLACVGVLALTGCGDDGGSEAKTLTLDETPAATESGAATEPADDGAIPEDPLDGEVARGTSVAASPDEQAAAEVWFSYWTEVVRMYHDGEADRDALYALADRDAATGPLEYLERMKSRGETQTGGVVAAISKIRVTGDEAVVEGCFRDTTVTLARNGNPAETGLSFFTTKGTLVREGPDWRVVEANTTSENQECDYR